MEFTGELAALTTALCWSFTSMFFTQAGRLIGSFKVNNIRLIFAVSIYCVALLATTGQILPDDITVQHIFWLGLSGVVGLVIGDSALFKSQVMIGPRLAMLLHSSAPVMATIIAWIFLREVLSVIDVLGISITVTGISWVVAERRYRANNYVAHGHPDAGSLAKGVALALLGAFGQAAGLVVAKYGMLNVGAPVEPMPASFIRMAVSMICIWAYTVFCGKAPETIAAARNLKALGLSLSGAITGPFLGVWMSLVAVKYIEAGIAATLNATTPIWIIPLVIIIYKEKVSIRALLGAIVAVAGVALLMVS
ncbi:MAG: DMT family transporter [Candidatus Zixiibacteriota bacterium]|nr:MAG: DMT family transporter [candidate division Zixibacteria bacterium]